MKLAIVGSGISGLTAAHRLHPHHELTIFEAAGYVGGHTNTIDVPSGDRTIPVDTGFIVFNHKTYPGFKALLEELGVDSQPSSMSFSVKCEQTGLEYNGTNMNTLFAQRRNLLSPRFWGMLREIVRFNREVKTRLQNNEIDEDQTLGNFLSSHGFSESFSNYYILPMGSAIWSAGRQQMLAFPLLFFATFFENHGMLNIDDRPLWRVVKGGSRSYVDKLIQPFQDRIRLNTPVQRIERRPYGVYVTTHQGRERFDEVILAVHSDQALKLLADPTSQEERILKAIGYQRNEAILHTDTRILPRSKRAWAAWNYHVLDKARGTVAVTYNMNILQNLDTPETYCVTLNDHEAIDPSKIIERIIYHHPIFSPLAVEAQKRHHLISGVNRTHYCGAYWFYGFHEDGLRSGQRVAEQILERVVQEAVPA